MTLADLPRRQPSTVQSVHEQAGDDAIARRLRELGFVPGEAVEVVARAPFGGDPILVQVGYTRFALRRSEAARVQVEAA